MLTANQVLDLKLRYDTQGFVHLKNLLPDEVLARARSAFDAASVRHSVAARDAVARGARFYDMPAILDADPVFIDMVDLPQLLPLLRATVGEDIALHDTSARLFFPGPTFTSPFHSDLARVIGVNQGATPNFMAKVHFYLEDLAPEQGCLAFIPGSQHFPPLYVDGHRDTLAASSAVVRVVPRAGDAILFNTHVLHMAEANNTAQVRKSMIYTYSHFWMKHNRGAIPADLDAFADNPQRLQLFGVDVPGLGHFDRRLDRLAAPTTVERLQSVGERIARRVLPLRSASPQG